MSRTVNIERIANAYDAVEHIDLSYMDGVFKGYVGGSQFNLGRGQGRTPDGFGPFDPQEDAFGDVDFMPLIAGVAVSPDDLEAQKYKKQVEPDMWVVGDFLSERLLDRNGSNFSPAEIGLYGLTMVYAYAAQQGVKVGSIISDGKQSAVLTMPIRAKDAMVSLLNGVDAVLRDEGRLSTPSLAGMLDIVSAQAKGSIVVPVSDFRQSVTVDRKQEDIVLDDGTDEWSVAMASVALQNAVLPLEVRASDALDSPARDNQRSALVRLSAGTKFLERSQVEEQRDLYAAMAEFVDEGVQHVLRATNVLHAEVSVDSVDPIRDIVLGLQQAARAHSA